MLWAYGREDGGGGGASYPAGEIKEGFSEEVASARVGAGFYDSLEPEQSASCNRCSVNE